MRRTTFNKIWVAIVGLLVAGGSLYWYKHRQVPFDMEEWRPAGAVSSFEIIGARQYMVKDLMERRLSVGMPKTKVVELLGKPDEEAERSISYVIGKRFDRILTVRLLLNIGFDENLQLSSVEITEQD